MIGWQRYDEVDVLERKRGTDVIYEGKFRYPLEYDLEPTLLQRQIEMQVTGGRGYLPFGESLALVREHTGELSYKDALRFVPIYLPEDAEIQRGVTNPCSEIAIGELEACQLPAPELTLAEQMRNYRIGKTAGEVLEKEKKAHPHALVDVFPRFSWNFSTYPI